MAIKTISQFPSGIPADNDYILFEKNGEGKSAKFSDFSLSYEEIMATNPEPDLSGKVASAGALNTVAKKTDILSSIVENSAYVRIDEPYSYAYVVNGVCFMSLNFKVLQGSSDSTTLFSNIPSSSVTYDCTVPISIGGVNRSFSARISNGNITVSKGLHSDLAGIWLNMPIIYPIV